MEKMTFIYKIGSYFVPLFYKIIFRLKVYGRENFPDDGPFVIASNHYSNWDPMIVGIAALPFPIKYMAKKELFKNKLFAALIKAGGAFPVDRGIVKASTFKEIEKIFNNKGIILMFPQGTRSRKNPNARPKKGTAYIAIKFQVPVVPVHIEWPDTPLKVFLKRKHVKIIVKKPLTTPAKFNEESIKNYTEKIWNEIIK